MKENLYATYEHKSIYALLMAAAGMMGAYTFTLRGGVFCNAQTANVVLMSIAMGKGNWSNALYYLIPISAYLLGALISELFINPVRKIGVLRWNTYLVAIEAVVLFGIGFVPLSVPDKFVQVTINFIASMQYNSFRQAEGIPMATTFCTNHVRQMGISIANVIKNRNSESLKRGAVHLMMVLFFIAGGISLTYSNRAFGERSIWLALIPLGITLMLLVHADIAESRKK